MLEREMRNLAKETIKQIQEAEVSESINNSQIPRKYKK